MFDDCYEKIISYEHVAYHTLCNRNIDRFDSLISCCVKISICFIMERRHLYSIEVMVVPNLQNSPFRAFGTH